MRNDHQCLGRLISHSLASVRDGRIKIDGIPFFQAVFFLSLEVNIDRPLQHIEEFLPFVIDETFLLHMWRMGEDESLKLFPPFQRSDRFVLVSKGASIPNNCLSLFLSYQGYFIFSLFLVEKGSDVNVQDMGDLA